MLKPNLKHISDVYSFSSNFGTSVQNKDGNGKVSKGDTVIITDGETNEEYTRIRVTVDQASHINGYFGSQIELSNEQITSLIGGPVPSDFGYYALDSDNSGQLSEGDKLVTFGTFTVSGLTHPNYKTVTAADIQGITDPTVGAISEVSNEGINYSEGVDVPSKSVGEVRVGKQQLPPYLAHLPKPNLPNLLIYSKSEYSEIKNPLKSKVFFLIQL